MYFSIHHIFQKPFKLCKSKRIGLLNEREIDRKWSQRFKYFSLTTDKTPKQEVNNDIEHMSNTMDPTDLVDISRIFHPPTFTKSDQILGHKTSLDILKNIYPKWVF